MQPDLTAPGTRVPYGITRCHLPPSRGDIPAFTPAKLVVDLATPEGMQGLVDLGTAVSAQPVPKAVQVYRSGGRDEHNRPWRDSNLVPLILESGCVNQ